MLIEQGSKPDQPTVTSGQAPDAAPDFDSEDLDALIAQIAANPKSAAFYVKRLRGESAKRREDANKAKADAERLLQLEAERKQQEEAAMKEQGKWKQLAEQREQELAQRQQEAEALKPYRAAFEAQLKRRLDELPEEQRRLVPDLGDPLKTLEWLDRAEGSGLIGRAKRQVPIMDAGAGQKVSEEAQTQMSRQIALEEHLKRLRGRF